MRTSLNNQIKFKFSIRSNLCDYSDVYILISGSITIDGEGDDAAKLLDEGNKGEMFKNRAPFT